MPFIFWDLSSIWVYSFFLILKKAVYFLSTNAWNGSAWYAACVDFAEERRSHCCNCRLNGYVQALIEGKIKNTYIFEDSDLVIFNWLVLYFCKIFFCFLALHFDCKPRIDIFKIRTFWIGYFRAKSIPRQYPLLSLISANLIYVYALFGNIIE